MLCCCVDAVGVRRDDVTPPQKIGDRDGLGLVERVEPAIAGRRNPRGHGNRKRREQESTTEQSGVEEIVSEAAPDDLAQADRNETAKEGHP